MNKYELNIALNWNHLTVIKHNLHLQSNKSNNIFGVFIGKYRQMLLSNLFRISTVCVSDFFHCTSTSAPWSDFPDYMELVIHGTYHFLQHIPVSRPAVDRFTKTSSPQHRRVSSWPDQHPVSSSSPHPARLRWCSSCLIQLLQQHTDAGQHTR